ncbi:MAG TPA: alkaline phosphatase family protein, partial [Methylomirabilota bacterium]|nr:alkaline phosphatase family protein [Methylomirabilota bacterium]
VSRRRLLVLLLAASCALSIGAAAAAPAPPPLLLIVSVDGLRPDHVSGADARGVTLPALRRLVAEGAFAEGVQGVVPTTTYPSHTTLLTGVWPARHGIFANTLFDPQRLGEVAWYWYAEDIRVPTLWDAAARAGWKTASLNWPVSVGARVDYAVPEFWHVGGPGDARLLRVVSTPGLLAEMEAALGPYPRALDVEADEGRGRFAVWLLEHKRPSLLTLHLIALDHAQHEHGPFAPEVMAVLERQDAVLARLRATAERLAPGRTWMAVVSDHGFAAMERQLNLLPAFRAAGLVTLDRRRVTEWSALPWSSGGSAAIVLKDPADGATRTAVRQVLARLAAEHPDAVDRVLEADALHARGGFPPASFLLGIKPGWQVVASATAGEVTRVRGGTHGHLPDVPELRAAFFLVGPGVPAGRALGLVDMRDIAPTLAQRAGLALPSADGKTLLP